MVTPFNQNDKYTVDKSIQRNLRIGILDEDDAEILRNYIHYRSVTQALTQGRQTKLVSMICGLQKLDPVCHIRQLNIENIYGKIQTLHASDYSQNSKHDFIIIGKGFWKYLSENKIIDIDVKKLKAIKSIPINHDTTSPNEILTEEEVMSLINHGGTARNRALIAVLYESACRISELASIRWKDLIFDEHGVKLYIHDHKTKKTRYCRLIISEPHLIEWRNNYEKWGSATGDNFVFVNRYRLPIKYAGYVTLLKRIAADAKLKKKIHLHLMRKSRITHMVKNNYQESIIKQIAWGNLNTSMMQTYVRLSENDIDSELLDHMGVVNKAEEDNVLKPVRCIRCGAVIAPDQKYCGKCGLSRDTDMIDAAMSVDQELVTKILEILRNQNKG